MLYCNFWFLLHFGHFVIKVYLLQFKYGHCIFIPFNPFKSSFASFSDWKYILYLQCEHSTNVKNLTHDSQYIGLNYQI